MIAQLTNNRYLSMLTKSVDNTAYRHKLLVNNVANVNTPSYKRRDVADFQKALREAEGKTSFRASTQNPRHIQFGSLSFEELRPRSIKLEQTSYRNDNSSVDVDLEMAEMSKNGLRYQAYTQKLNGYFRSYKELLQGE